MSDSFLDHLPSAEREKIRKRLRSPAEYERLRERVKGPKDLETELARAEHLAEVHFGLESDPKMQEKARVSLERELKGDLENVLEHADQLSPEVREALAKGKFTVNIAPHPKDHHDVLMVAAEGTVQERIAIKPALQDKLLSALRTSP